MNNRRNFIKSTLVVASGLAISGTAFAKGNLPAPKKEKSPKFSGIIYSAKDQGDWEGKAGSHAPKITMNGSKVTILTDHGMSERHFIVRHTLVTPKGEVLGTQTFYPNEDEKALSTHDLPEAYSGKLYATSFCNKHDFWVTEFEV
jgi:superoxide reductase